MVIAAGGIYTGEDIYRNDGTWGIRRTVREPVLTTDEVTMHLPPS